MYFALRCALSINDEAFYLLWAYLISSVMENTFCIFRFFSNIILLFLSLAFYQIIAFLFDSMAQDRSYRAP